MSAEHQATEYALHSYTTVDPNGVDWLTVQNTAASNSEWITSDTFVLDVTTEA